MQENIFTVSAIDNLDYNPSSSTAKDSFHGTGILIFQFQTNHDNSFKFELSKTSRNNDSPPSLPSYYPNVKPKKSTPSTPRISSINSTNSMDVDHFDSSVFCSALGQPLIIFSKKFLTIPLDTHFESL